MLIFAFLWRFSVFCALALGAQTANNDFWTAPAFSLDPAALRQKADEISADKHIDATILLYDLRFAFDESGRMAETNRLIYRVENQDGVENWSEVSAQWQAWYQDRPEIKARVITSEGVVHWLDPKTLNDFPVHEKAPDVYSDERKYGGPLPAIAPGAIVEEEWIVRDFGMHFELEFAQQPL